MWNKRMRGFTLLEILVAIFIFMLVSLITASVLRSVLLNQARLTYKISQLTELQMALVLLSRDIEQSIDRPVLNAKNIQQPACLGTSRDLALTHSGYPNPGALVKRSTLERTHYFRDNEGNIIRETWPVLDSASATTAAQRTILTRVKALSFAYYKGNQHWATHWPQPNFSLPKAIKVKIIFVNGGHITQLFTVEGNPLALY